MCRYCEINKDGYLKVLMSDVVESRDGEVRLPHIVQVGGNRLFYDGYKLDESGTKEVTHTFSCEINYCPMCGKSLAGRDYDCLGNEH